MAVLYLQQLTPIFLLVLVISPLLIRAGPLSLSSSVYQSQLIKRRISDSNSNPPVLQKLHDLEGCPGEICGTLSGEAVQPLLAGAGECAQQDMADKIIDAANNQIKDTSVRKKMIELALDYRKSERNTFPDYSKQPEPDQNSLYCQKSPKNHELIGLFQKQSPNAKPDLFFDPKSTSPGKSITKGSDPRTLHFGSKGTDGKNDFSVKDKSSTTSSSGSKDSNVKDDSTMKDMASSESESEDTKVKNDSGVRDKTSSSSSPSPKTTTATTNTTNSKDSTEPEDDDDHESLESSSTNSNEESEEKIKKKFRARNHIILRRSENKTPLLTDESTNLANSRDSSSSSSSSSSAVEDPGEKNNKDTKVNVSKQSENKTIKSDNSPTETVDSNSIGQTIDSEGFKSPQTISNKPDSITSSSLSPQHIKSGGQSTSSIGSIIIPLTGSQTSSQLIPISPQTIGSSISSPQSIQSSGFSPQSIQSSGLSPQSISPQLIKSTSLPQSSSNPIGKDCPLSKSGTPQPSLVGTIITTT